MASPEHEPTPARAPDNQPPAISPPAQEESDLTWEDKEDKLDAENIQPNTPEPTATDKKYQYKEGGPSELCFVDSRLHFSLSNDLISHCVISVSNDSVFIFLKKGILWVFLGNTNLMTSIKFVCNFNVHFILELISMFFWCL